ncbi:MAG: DNA alkylation repair protein [Bacteroidetes bacterium]|nr:DNA alkylation repair protein [Bacteroidota bacterium]
MIAVNTQIVKSLKSKASKERAQVMARFFKTGKGEYAEGDIFHGVSVPDQRVIAKKYFTQSDAASVSELLKSRYHEERLTALVILTHLFEQAKKKGTEELYVNLYLKEIHYVNNWDLVDSTAHKILGRWLENKNRKILYKLADSKNLWENRVAVIATYYFIKKNDFTDILKLSEKLLLHPHDLMHKAIGWMLREAWKINPGPIETFLQDQASVMPRTMLRYAIEKMTDSKRKHYLNAKNHTFKS